MLMKEEQVTRTRNQQQEQQEANKKYIKKNRHGISQLILVWLAALSASPQQNTLRKIAKLALLYDNQGGTHFNVVCFIFVCCMHSDDDISTHTMIGQK